MRTFRVEAFESHTAWYEVQVEDNETAEDAVKAFQAGNGRCIDNSGTYVEMDNTRGGLGADQLRMLKHEVPEAMDTGGIRDMKEVHYV